MFHSFDCILQNKYPTMNIFAALIIYSTQLFIICGKSLEEFYENLNVHSFITLESLDCTNLDSSDINTRLRKKLFCDYEKSTRPGQTGNPVMMSVDFVLKSFDFVSLFESL